MTKELKTGLIIIFSLEIPDHRYRRVANARASHHCLRKVGKEFEFRVSGSTQEDGSEFQSRGPMTEKALLPSDDLTYGMDRTSKSARRSCRNRV